MKNSIYILILILGTLSCDKGKGNEDLFVEWHWETTDGGFAYSIYASPESTGKTINLILKDNHTYSIIENGSEVAHGSFKLKKKKSIYSGQDERFIQISCNDYVVPIVLSGIINTSEKDHLSISDNNYDGIGSRFVKID